MNNENLIAELMKKFDLYRAQWLATYGSDNGFNEWFTNQVMG
jgi:hypothetical protein